MESEEKVTEEKVNDDVQTASSSDTDSWTIIDEEEESDHSESNVAVFADKNLVKFARVAAKEASTHSTDSSDIETLEETQELPPVTNLQAEPEEKDSAEENFDSFVSDGIPVCESLEGDQQQQWIWASEETLLTQSSSSELSCELPAEFPSIAKGHTYNHVPKRRLNDLLTTVLILSCALVIGLGVGHFLGWSEKLELQEHLAEEREVKLEELTDSLVTCITGEEGNGGDDPDLEERVIKQLSAENNELKLALAQMKACQDSPAQIPVLLRQRINELLVANADLEKEVARLRYSHSAIKDAENTKSKLLKAKVSLNDVTSENEQLKLVIGKTRYGAPPEVKQSLNNTNEEEGKEEEYQATNETQECPRTMYEYVKKSYNDLKQYNLKDATMQLGKSLNVENILRSIPTKVAPAGKQLVRRANYIVKNLENSLNKGLDKASQFFEDQVGENPSQWKEKQLRKLEQGLNLLLDDWNFDDAFAKGEQPLPDKEKEANEPMIKKQIIDPEFETDKKSKEGKSNDFDNTISKEEKRIKKEEKKKWKAEKKRLKEEERKWKQEEKKWKQEEKKWKQEEKRLRKEEKEKKKLAKEKDAHRWNQETNNADKDKHRLEENGKKVKEDKKGWKKDRKWKHDKNADKNGTSKWMFDRAQNRETFRKEDRKSDWMFDRANDRKKFHKLTDAEWYEQKLLSKDCHSNDNDGEVCEDLNEVRFLNFSLCF